MNWFECRITHEKTLENGLVKKVTEPYLVDAISHTEAEARIIEEVRPYISNHFEVATIRPQKISEMFFSEEECADKWYKVKLEFITLDEKSGNEKRTKVSVMVQAADIRDALKKLDEGMKGTMADYDIVQITETNVMDVYPISYEAH